MFIFALIFAIPLLAVLLCMALNQVLPTRWLGLGSAVAMLVAMGLLLMAPLPMSLPIRTWVASGEQSVELVLSFDALSSPFAVLTFGGGALALVALALALPRDLRGFGGMFAAIGLAQVTVVAGIANQDPLLLPFAWSLVTLLGFAALRASGAPNSTSALPPGLLTGLAGALLLAGATLASATAPFGPVALSCWTLVALLAFGAPPFHAAFDEAAEAPAALMGSLLPLGLPLLGGYVLLQFPASMWADVPFAWRMTWVLLGLLAWLVCAAGAFSAMRLRRLINWQFSAQLGLVFICVGLGGEQPPLALAAGLLVNAVLTTLVSYLALAVLERRAGTDDLAAIGMHGPLLVPGLSFLVAIASSVGFPGTWGWWVYSALFGHLRTIAPWLIAPLLAGAALRVLAYVTPLAAFWRVAPPKPAGEAVVRRGWPRLLAAACPALVALALAVWGFAPQFGWRAWQADGLRFGEAPAPSMLMQVFGTLGLLVLLAWLMQMTRGQRRHQTVAQAEIQNPGLLGPLALGQGLRGLSVLASPTWLFERLWAGLLWFSRTLARLLSLFEQRYYLAGLMISVIVVILLMI